MNGSSLHGLAAFVLVFNVVRYVVVAGGVHWLTQNKLPAHWATRRIGKPANRMQAKRDLRAGLISSALFAGFGYLIRYCEAHGISSVGADWWMNSVACQILAIVLMMLLQDAGFYWAHRAMHTRWLFPIHRLHHQSSDPTALSAFSFSTGEAVVQGLIASIPIILIPAQIWAHCVFIMLTFMMSVYGHMGVELFPAWLVRSPFTQIVNTTTYHHMHHRSAKTNLGLYLRFWDRVVGTEHPHYEETVLATSAAPLIAPADANGLSEPAR